MADVSVLIFPFILAMIGLVVAVFERGYKRYQDEKANNPDLHFSGAYIVNMVLTAGGVGTLLAIITAVIASLQSGETAAEVNFIAAIGQFGLGYLLSYRVLDGLNNRTEKKIEVAAATK